MKVRVKVEINMTMRWAWAARWCAAAQESDSESCHINESEVDNLVEK